jgi:hypothetical protein
VGARRAKLDQFGLEFDQHRAHYIQTRLKHHLHLIHGNARHLATYSVPLIDFLLTSPPASRCGSSRKLIDPPRLFYSQRNINKWESTGSGYGWSRCFFALPARLD